MGWLLTSSKQNFFFHYCQSVVVLFRSKEEIRTTQHEKMFIFYGTLETLPAADNKGRSFTQILSSVCDENGGAVDILEIEK